jgi:hypothetical protein
VTLSQAITRASHFSVGGLHISSRFYQLIFGIAGRRTLEAYTVLFLQGLPAAAEHDHSRIASRVLNTHGLGEHVAPHWRLQDVMRWVPPRAGEAGIDGRAAGLHKVAGTMVEAVVGGVLHQFVSCILCSPAVDAGPDHLTGRERRSQTFPYPRASAFITPRLTIRAAGYPSCRRAESSSTLWWSEWYLSSEFLDERLCCAKSTTDNLMIIIHSGSSSEVSRHNHSVLFLSSFFA